MNIKKNIRTYKLSNHPYGNTFSAAGKIAREYIEITYRLRKSYNVKILENIPNIELGNFPYIDFKAYHPITKEELKDNNDNSVTICTGIISSSNVSLTVISKLTEFQLKKVKKYETVVSFDKNKGMHYNDTLYSKVIEFFDEMYGIDEQYGIKKEVKK